MTLIDEYTRECLALPVERRMGSRQVIETLADVMLWRGVHSFRQRTGVHRQTAAPVAGKGGDEDAIYPRDECLNGEIFCSLKEAQIVIQGWRKQYNTVRPPLGYRPPAPGVTLS